MDADDLTNHLTRLQAALLEGKIDQATYARLKADLGLRAEPTRDSHAPRMPTEDLVSQPKAAPISPSAAGGRILAELKRLRAAAETNAPAIKKAVVRMVLGVVCAMLLFSSSCREAAWQGIRAGAAEVERNYGEAFDQSAAFTIGIVVTCIASVIVLRAVVREWKYQVHKRRLTELAAAIAHSTDTKEKAAAYAHRASYYQSARWELILLNRNAESDSCGWQAIADYGRAIELDPTNGHYRRYRGDVYREYQSDFESALADYDVSINVLGEDGPFLERAKVFVKLGRCKEAIDDCDQGLSRSRPGSLYHQYLLDTRAKASEALARHE